MRASVSHAWIGLHRCVESNARLTGETFNSIFYRIEETFSFKRTDKNLWPNLAQIREAAWQLKKERKLYLDELQILVEKRKVEKKHGKRENTDSRLNLMCEERNQHHIPRVGFWGWKKGRKMNKTNLAC